ncbi:MAG: DUF2125 domain-containing protein [Acetobacteraceae bacterium]|nr:DUF2125 domain-containing protein [Acetobacteraceae bacterium]
MARARSGRALRLGLAAGALALVALVGTGHFLLWNALAGAIEDGMAAWAEERRAAGWDVSYGPPERHGWPVAAEVRFPGLTIASGPSSPVAFLWAAGAAEARIAPPDLRLIEVDLPDPQILLVEGTEIRFAAERLVLRFRIEGGAPPQGGTLEASRLRIAAPPLLPGRAAEAASLTATLALRPDATEAEAALTLTLAAQGVVLPQPGPLGRSVEQAALTLQASGPVPGRRGLRQRAETWRDAGGSVALSGVLLHYGPLRATGEATLALDAALQPMGAGRIVTTGHDAALSALAEAGVLTRAAAAQYGLALRLVQRVPEGGGEPRAELPLLLENRRLSVLGIPLARLPRLPWPALPEAAQ